MLVLPRGKNERVIIGDDIAVGVIEVRRDEVQLGIDAPNELTVYPQPDFETTAPGTIPLFSSLWRRIASYVRGKPAADTSAPLPSSSTSNAHLVISRKKDEMLTIGDRITVMVIEIRGDKVRLGIEAPKEVTVHREEVYRAIRREQEE